MFRMARLLIVLVLITAALPALNVQAQTADTVDTAAIDQIMTEAMAMYEVPGAALAIVKDGAPLYVQGYGVRSTETNLPVDGDSLFAIGSVTKSFTALGVFELVAQGKLDLDTPIIEYLPSFKLSDENATNTVTLRHLLTHSSGLPRADQWAFDDPKTREQVIAEMADIDLSTDPGKLWQYNNQNFVLAGYLIEQITGQTWESYITQHIFDPLDMTTANFALEIQDSENWAVPHGTDILEGNVPIDYLGSLGAVGPAGSINASANDMAKYALFQLSDGGDVLTADLMAEMHRGQIEMPSNKELYGDAKYAFGWWTLTYREHRLVEHDGGIFGYISKLTLVPDDNIGIAVLTNANGGALLTEVVKLKLLDLLLGLEPERDITAYVNELAQYDPVASKAISAAARAYEVGEDEFAPLIGAYGGSLGISIELRGDELWMVISQQGIETVLIPYEAGKFVSNTSPANGLLFRFAVDEDGTVTMFQTAGGRDIEIARKVASGTETATAEYPDPQGKFTLTAPKSLVINSVQSFLIAQLSNPNGAIIIGSAALEEDALITVMKWVQQFDPTFQMEPAAVTTYTDVDGDEWQQFEFGLPSAQTLVARALVNEDVVIIVVFQMRTVDRSTIEQVANQLTDGIE